MMRFQYILACRYHSDNFLFSDLLLNRLLISIQQIPFQQRAESRQQDDLPDLQIASFALAKHKNKRFYKAKVVHVDRKRLYEVDFDDGSFSEDLLPEDIAVSYFSEKLSLS